MITVAVASGKGGTGKTTIAVSMALSSPEETSLLDCDVEEPNAHLFIKPRISETAPVELLIPEVDAARCTVCGACARACRFHALAVLKAPPIVFPELCHSCGGCILACPVDALTEVPFRTGVVERGSQGLVHFAAGKLDVGRALSVPIIRAVRATTTRDEITIIDAPPGTSCPVIASVRGADFVLLVTEPTPFGLNDLGLAVDMVRSLDIPFGVVVNRSDIGDRGVFDYCLHGGIPILLEIPEDRRIAEAYSRGVPAVEALPALREELAGLLTRIRETVAGPSRKVVS